MGKSEEELGRALTISDVNRLHAYDVREGLPDTWLREGVRLLAFIAQVLGLKNYKLPNERQRAAQGSGGMKAMFRAIAKAHGTVIE